MSLLTSVLNVLPSFLGGPSAASTSAANGTVILTKLVRDLGVLRAKPTAVILLLQTAITSADTPLVAKLLCVDTLSSPTDANVVILIEELKEVLAAGN